MDISPCKVFIEFTERILMQMKNSVCCIYLNDGCRATDFFCKIPFKDKIVPVMITNHHVFDEKILEKEKIFYISLNNGKKMKK